MFFFGYLFRGLYTSLPHAVPDHSSSSSSSLSCFVSLLITLICVIVPSYPLIIHIYYIVYHLNTFYGVQLNFSQYLVQSILYQIRRIGEKVTSYYIIVFICIAINICLYIHIYHYYYYLFIYNKSKVGRQGSRHVHNMATSWPV